MARIEWNYPEPRGAVDRFIGPGATGAEIALQAFGALGLGIAAMLYPVLNNLEWTTVQLIVAALIGLDIGGGITTNATSTAKRWYHREGQGFRQHLMFVAGHLLHLVVVAGLFRGDWIYAAVFYAYLLAASIIVLQTPLYLQRVMALILLCGAILINLYVLPPTPGLEWFIPFFFLKLLVAHLLREEPYRPD